MVLKRRSGIKIVSWDCVVGTCRCSSSHYGASLRSLYDRVNKLATEAIMQYLLLICAEGPVDDDRVELEVHDNRLN